MAILATITLNGGLVKCIQGDIISYASVTDRPRVRVKNSRVWLSVGEISIDNVAFSELSIAGVTISSQATLDTGLDAVFPEANSGSGGSGYLVYTALLTQSGTAAPIATVLENTIGATVVWSRSATGQYIATVSGNLFPTNRTYVAGYGDWEGSATPFTPILSNTEIVGYYALFVAPLDQDRFFMRVKDEAFTDADLGDIIGSGKLFLPKVEVYPA